MSLLPPIVHPLLRAIALFASLAGTAAASPPRVVASIAPVHSIVAGVMDGIAAPSRLLSPERSPHGYTLRPSEAQLLASADLVVWVGPELETFMTRPLAALATDAEIVQLTAEPGIARLPWRDPLQHDAGGHGDSGHAGHDHGGIDPHVWLSLANARVIATAVSGHLQRIDPGNATAYVANADRLERTYTALEHEVRSRLAPLAGIPFMVFHDAYQYFEREMGLDNRGALTLRPELSPGVERMRALRRTVREAGVRCIFSEPQFPARLVAAVGEDSGARIATLDPLGFGIESGPGGYEALMRQFASQVVGCLSGEPAGPGT